MVPPARSPKLSPSRSSRIGNAKASLHGYTVRKTPSPIADCAAPDARLLDKANAGAIVCPDIWGCDSGRNDGAGYAMRNVLTCVLGVVPGALSSAALAEDAGPGSNPRVYNNTEEIFFDTEAGRTAAPQLSLRFEDDRMTVIDAFGTEISTPRRYDNSRTFRKRRHRAYR